MCPEDSTSNQPKAGGPLPATSPQANRWRRAAPWLAIILAAVGIRCAYLWQIHTIPFFDTPVGDAASYDTWGQSIAGGNWLGNEVFYQAPAYPYFLGAIYTLVADTHRLLAARLVQVALGSIACLLLGLATANFFSRRCGLIAAGMLAFYPPAIFFDGLIQKASLNLALTSLLIWRLSTMCRKPSMANWMGVGVVLGLLGLTRENAMALIPIVMLWAWFGFRKHARPIRVRWLVGLCGGLALVLFPVAARNHHIGGEWLVTTSQAGPNFFIGNNATATGRYAPLVPGHETPEFERDDAFRLAEETTGRTLTPREVSRFWFGQSWAFMREAPLRWVGLLAKKILLVFNEYEITDVEGYNVYRDFSTTLSILSVVGHFGILCPLAIAGMAMRGSRNRQHRVLIAMSATFALSVAVFFVFARYRLPLVPMLLPFAAFALVEGRNRLRTQQKLAMPAVVLILATITCNWPINPKRQLNAMAYFNLGTVLAKRGDISAAVEVWKISLEENPGAKELHYNLGLAYLLQGEVETAIDHLSTAKQIDPDLVEVDHQLGKAFESMRQWDKAIWHYREALRINPSDAQSEAALARMQKLLRTRADDEPAPSN